MLSGNNTYMAKEEEGKERQPEVALFINQSLNYPVNGPFSPHQPYPEYPFEHLSSQVNPVYEAVRRMFVSMGYDKGNFGKSLWSPLGHIISPGNKVVIKPNWVYHHNASGHSFTGMVTHSSVIRALLDYIIIALKEEGEIIIGDAPVQAADFSAILANSQIESVVSFVSERTQVEIRIDDFRREMTVRENGLVLGRTFRQGDDFVEVNLEHNSFLSSIGKSYEQFRVTNYDKDRMSQYHNLYDHIYVIHRSIFEADAVISIPKLKTHRKAGFTSCLKNTIGINCQKDCLPHHRRGSNEEGGDAYCRRSFLKRIKEILYESLDKTCSLARQRFYNTCINNIDRLIKLLSIGSEFEGSWYGNDTLWRTILDINRILLYADSNGALLDRRQRKVLYVVDGIIAGEGEGPLEPTNRDLGLMAAGENPLVVDLVISKVIGFDYKKIPCLFHAVNSSCLWNSKFSNDDIWVNSNSHQAIRLKDLDVDLRLEPSSGWKGHIEQIPKSSQ